ncbi:hypothetical protein GCM10028808_31450 [Spirosoma migulaei]
MADGIDNNGKQKHNNGDPIDAMHHAEVYTRRLIWVRFAEYPQEIRKDRPNFEVIDESVHEEN